MSQWRQDPLSGRWVIVAARRGRRPDEFAGSPPVPADPVDCPFCPGHEKRTTPEIMAVGRPAGRPADGPGWRLRVFPNMYPALSAEAPAAGDEPWPAQPGIGRHEVVVTTPDHAGGLHTLGAEGLTAVLGVLRDRTRELVRLPEVRHVLPFFNQGAAAGATLAHPHGQILAAPLVPQLVVEETRRFADHRATTGECLLCGLVAREEEAGDRLVAAGPGGVVMAPWASRFPYEMLAVPRAHATGIEDARDEDLAGLAEVMARGLATLADLVPEPALNMVLHGITDTDFHWHVEILPRLVRLAGFEAGSGFAINAIPPETAARRLRGEET